MLVLCHRIIQHLELSTETKNPATIMAHKMKLEFFTTNVLSEICRRLILHYFLLTSEDLEIWDTDPEDFGERVLN